jgi:hypothetical protein
VFDEEFPASGHNNMRLHDVGRGCAKSALGRGIDIVCEFQLFLLNQNDRVSSSSKQQRGK